MAHFLQAKNLIIIQLFFLLCVFQNLKAQALDPSSASQNVELTVMISYPGIEFQQSSPTICPSTINVSVSNVVFKQGSYTIYPNYVYTFNGTLYLDIIIPADAPLGYYDAIYGYGEPCEFIDYGSFNIYPYIQVYPYYSSIGQTLDVNISGTNVSFQQSSPTICPGSLNVNLSNVFFTQGSATIYPNSIYTYGGEIYANVTFPSSATIGYYDIVIGNGETCEIKSSNAFYLDLPYIGINVTPGFVFTGQSLNVDITGTGVTFQQSSPTVCPGSLNVTASDVVFAQGSETIYPDYINISGNVINAHLNIPSNASPGYYDLIVGANSGCSIIEYNALHVDNNIINLSPSQSYPGTQLSVDISGPSVVFQQSSPTVCPSSLNVSVSDVVFIQGSYTINPSAVNTSNGILTADLSIPSDAPTGSYLVVVGNSCPYYGSFNLLSPVGNSSGFTFNNVSKTYGDPPFLMTATSNSSGAITYSVISGTAASINPTSGMVTISGSGSVTVQASQAADGIYSSSILTAVLTISKRTPTITFPNVSITYGDTMVFMVATSNSTAPITYSVLSGTAAIIDPSTGEISTFFPGTVTIQASQDADQNNKSAIATATLTINIRLGISNGNNTNELSIYPNPSSDIIFIEGIESSEIKILNTEGKVIKIMSGKISSVNIQELKSGYYILQIRTKKGLSYQGFIKN